VTVVAILLSAALGLALYFAPQKAWYFLLIPLGLLIRMALNAIDGMIARQYNMQSQLGEVLNELGDVVSDLCLILPFAFFSQISSEVVIAFALLTIINEFAGVLGKAMGGERRYEGPMGKSDRALLISLFCIFCFFFPKLIYVGTYVFGIAILLLLLSTFTRLKKAIA